MKRFKKLLCIALLALLILLTFALGYYLFITRDTKLIPEKLNLSNTQILLYDREGERIETASLFSLKQTTKIDNIPVKTQLAFVHTEDKRFYKHNGFDKKRIVKAIFQNVKTRSFKEGASTISQQLIKNTHLSQEKTISRKLKECKLTMALESKYSKQEILEKYLNSIYFGHNCFGIQCASAFYFGKLPEELTIADSAILAGLVKSPNNYSPFKHPEQCQKRKELVLSLMFANGSINEKERAEAMNTPLPIPNHKENANVGYLHFVFDEMTDIIQSNTLSIGEKIEIYTGLDPLLQRELEGLAENVTDCDATLLALDLETNTFKGCASSVGNIRRLPGSLIKPILVYGPALEENQIVPATPLLDEKVNYGGYAPENYDGCFHGYMSTRECVAQSLNIPAVKVLESLGLERASKYMQALNLPIPEKDKSLALALGGMSVGFSLKDIATGYTSFAHEGRLTPCGFIKEIKINGKDIYKQEEKSKKVFSEESAYLMTSMLQTTAKTGTAKKLRTFPLSIAGKTGTVGTKNGNTDAYSLAYTTKDLVAVWMGNADNSTIPYTGGGAPTNLARNIHEYLYNFYQKNKIPLYDFKKPEGIQSIEIDKSSYYDTHTIQLADNNSPKEYRMEELFKIDHLPSKRSDFFSKPSIPTPKIHLNGAKVVISFDRHSSPLYTYQIVRSNNVTHTMLYKGPLLKEFVDPSIEENKEYVYTIIPSYNNCTGSAVSLPSIQFTANSKKKEDILEKNWWEN